MPYSVAIIGPVPEHDLIQLSETARIEEIDLVPVLTPAGIRDTTPLGYISYIPCVPEAIRNLFADLPTGAGEKIPIFQRIESDSPPDFLSAFPILGFFNSPLNSIFVKNIWNTILSHESIMTQNRDILIEMMKYRRQKHQLIKISSSLSSISDLETILKSILLESRRVVGADAGSIYMRERGGPGNEFVNRLRFKIAQNDSVELPETTEITSIPIDTNTIAGYVAHTGEPLNIRDVYELDDAAPYTFGKEFDIRFGYRMKSMLTVPLKNMNGTVVGVVQLMNKKTSPAVRVLDPETATHEVIVFNYSDEDFIVSIASLAAVTMERAQLHEDIEKLFEGFMNSSIAAVDERDRVTSGHSQRVMAYSLALADAVSAQKDGPFADISFAPQRRRRLQFAALLHDIGKIGVPEALLNKDNRLSDSRMHALNARFDYLHLLHGIQKESVSNGWLGVEEIEADRSLLEKVNLIGFLPEEEYTRMEKLRWKQYTDPRGTVSNFLSDEDWAALSVRRGTLTDKERARINFHAVSTHRILAEIPWTSELAGIPEIAAHHHEKLDGSGYPDHLKESDITLEMRILAIADIFEALVAQDRPYKPAMSIDRALAILHEEAKAGKLDSALVDLFESAGIHSYPVQGFAIETPLTRPDGGEA